MSAFTRLMRYQELPVTALPAHVVDQAAPATLVAMSTFASILRRVFAADEVAGPVRR